MKHEPDFYKLTPENFRRMEDAEVYSMRFANRSGWAIAFIHEPTGTVCLRTDYGDWSFSWPSPGRGNCTLKEFLCGGHFEYLADKFEQGRSRRFDFESTVLNIKNKIAEASDDKPYTCDEDLVREMNDWLDEEAQNDTALFIDRMPSALSKLLGDAPYEYMVYDRDYRFYWLRDGILPALVEELRKTLVVTSK